MCECKWAVCLCAALPIDVDFISPKPKSFSLGKFTWTTTSVLLHMLVQCWLVKSCQWMLLAMLTQTSPCAKTEAKFSNKKCTGIIMEVLVCCEVGGLVGISRYIGELVEVCFETLSGICVYYINTSFV